MTARVVPTLRTFIAGEVAVGAYLNANVRDVGNFLLGPPICAVRQTVSQSIATGGTGTSLLWDTEDLDPDGVHSTISATDTFTVAVAGTYLAVVKYAPANPVAVAGGYQAWWTKNAVDVNGWGGTLPNTSTSFTGTCWAFAVIPCAAGDALKALAEQTSGAALGTQISGRFQSSAALYWVSR